MRADLRAQAVELLRLEREAGAALEDAAAAHLPQLQRRRRPPPWRRRRRPADALLPPFLLPGGRAALLLCAKILEDGAPGRQAAIHVSEAAVREGFIRSENGGSCCCARSGSDF